MTKRKARVAEPDVHDQLDGVALAPLPSDRLRELKDPETFRVFHSPSDPHHVGEYVISVSTEGVRIWPSHLWDPLCENLTGSHWRIDEDTHTGFLIEWWELELIGGKSEEIVKDRQHDIREIERELETWQRIRNGEARRIAIAKEIERTQSMRRLIDQALKVRAVWMPETVDRPRRGIWRELVQRRRDGR